jgi:hypothetical protein
MGEIKMISTEIELDDALSSSQLGRYEIVRLALQWILLNRQNEDFRKLTQTELINKALNNVVTSTVSTEKNVKLQQKE